MAVHPALAVCSRASARTFLLGYSQDTRALIAHLDVEASWLVASLRILDHDPALARALRARGLNAVAVDLWDEAALRAEGLESASSVVVFADRIDGAADRYRELLRSMCPAADISVVPRATGARANASEPARSSVHVATSWRFWALVGVVIVDAVTLMIPLTPLALVVAALVNRNWVRSAARFLDDLAEAR